MKIKRLLRIRCVIVISQHCASMAILALLVHKLYMLIVSATLLFGNDFFKVTHHFPI